METLEEIRRRKLEELMKRVKIPDEEENEEAQINNQLRNFTDKILSPEANERMNNLRIGMPEFARQVEILLYQLYQAGKITSILSDEQFKQILMQLTNKKDISIRRVNK